MTFPPGTKVRFNVPSDRQLPNYEERKGIVEFCNENDVYVRWHMRGSFQSWAAVYHKSMLIKMTDKEWETYIKDAKLKDLLK